VSGAWGENAPDPVVGSIGIILDGATIPPGDEQIEFDHAAARWRQLLRDRLTVAAEGPTDWAEHYYGATAFPGPGYDGDYDGEDVRYQPVQRGHRHPPQRLSAWTWGHALEHASAGDQPPLARALMTTATQTAMAANWRVAIIDAATATECGKRLRTFQRRGDDWYCGSAARSRSHAPQAGSCGPSTSATAAGCPGAPSARPTPAVIPSA
jgi:hypothetical protein